MHKVIKLIQSGLRKLISHGLEEQITDEKTEGCLKQYAANLRRAWSFGSGEGCIWRWPFVTVPAKQDSEWGDR